MGTTLYGTTSAGGTAGNGVLFSIDTDGSHYQILHNFTGGAIMGLRPLGG